VYFVGCLVHRLRDKKVVGVFVRFFVRRFMHDDVVDDSNRRRGFFRLMPWKNKIAVLVGDYLLSKGLLLSIDDDFDCQKNYISSSPRNE
jgi:hypothetical protein